MNRGLIDEALDELLGNDSDYQESDDFESDIDESPEQDDDKDSEAENEITVVVAASSSSSVTISTKPKYKNEVEVKSLLAENVLKVRKLSYLTFHTIKGFSLGSSKIKCEEQRVGTILRNYRCK